jgi:hypothetical protein
MKKVSFLVAALVVFQCYSCKKNATCTLPATGTISGVDSVNAGSSVTLTDSVSGGVWSSSNTACATVGSATGLVSGLAVGTASISYTTTNSCGSSSATHTVTVNAVTIAVGQNYGGGIIAYILQPADPGYSASVKHGLIAAPADQGFVGVKWDNGSSTITGATATAIGSGLVNTTAIIAIQGAGGYAAMACHNLSLGGYTDWCLPSRDELNELYVNRVAIGGFATGNYWSSSEVNTVKAWSQFFGMLAQTTDSKSSLNNVRAVRSF